MNIKEPIGKIHGPIQDALVREHKSKLDLVK